MEHAIETELDTLAVFDQGSGTPLLLWPSLYLDHRSFDAVVSELASEHRCIVIDGPGHGRSRGPRHPYDMGACARAAMQVLDALHIGDVDWIGNAWGGHVGARAAIDFPRRVRSLTAIGAPMHPLPSKTRLQKRVLLLLLRLGMPDRVGALVARAMLSPHAPRELHEHVRRVVRESSRAGLAEAIRSISIRRADIVRELPRITCPTLFVAGADDLMWPPDVAAAQAGQIRGAYTETLVGAGLLGPLERPLETAALVRSHLRKQRRPADAALA